MRGLALQDTKVLRKCKLQIKSLARTLLSTQVFHSSIWKECCSKSLPLKVQRLHNLILNYSHNFRILSFRVVRKITSFVLNQTEPKLKEWRAISMENCVLRLKRSKEKFKRVFYFFLSATWRVILLEVYNLVLSFI